MSWENMPGNERERFCPQCSRTVVNLSALTEIERSALLRAAKPGELCVAYYQYLSHESRGATAGAARHMSARSLLQLGAVAAYIAATGTVAQHASNVSASGSSLQESATEIYYSMRYEAEILVDVFREAIGLPPRYMIMGVMDCSPPPMHAPAPTAQNSASGQQM